MLQWFTPTNDEISADFVIDGSEVDPHETIQPPPCPRCRARLASWPGAPVYGDDLLLYWDQTHACGARIRVLADLG